MLSKEQILAANDRTEETVNVPEWGGDVVVRSMSGHDRDAIDAAMLDAQNNGGNAAENYRARVVAACVVNADGSRMFDDADIVELGGKSSLAISRVFDAAQRVSGLGKAGIERAEKN